MKKALNSDIFCFTLAAAAICCCFLLAFQPRSPGASDFTGITNIGIIEDPSGNMTQAEAAMRAADFKQQSKTSIYRKRTSAALWVRLNIKKTEASEGSKFLQIKNASLEDIEVFFPGQTMIHAGKKADVRELPVRTRVWTFPVPDTLKDSEPVFVRVKTTTIMWIPFCLLSTTALIQQSIRETLLFGIFFGILLAIFFVNLFSFIIMQNKNFLVYIFYLFFLLMYHMQVHGYLHLLAIPFKAEMCVLWISLCGAGIFMMLFAKHFLNLKKNLPAVDWVLNTGIVLFATQTIFGLFFSGIIANNIAYFTGMIVPLSIIVGTAKLYLSGMKYLRYYLVALCAMLSGVLIWSTAAYAEAHIPANYFFVIGTSIDSLLFTLAIFDQIRQDLVEKENISERENYYKDLSRTDALTGLYNRRYLSELINRLNAEAETPQLSALIMIDLDNFKDINDTFGHLVGDLLLTKVATKIKKHIRKTDIGCRYGGDEFLVYLPGANASVAHSIADGLRTDILADLSYSEEGQEIRHTVSIGVTENRNSDSFDGMFLRADAALYQAKNLGRNRISIL